MSPVKPVPDGYHTVTPYLAVRDAARALELYARAFGATEHVRMPGPGGSVMHAEVKIGDSMVMLGEESPDRGAPSPQTLGGSAVSLLLYLPDVDAAFARATGAGCKPLMPPTDMFWGDRMCKVEDQWGMATHKEDVSPEETARRAQSMNPGD
jgi:PhnB protein